MPGKYPQIYTKVTRNGIETLQATITPGTSASTSESVKDFINYNIKHYHRTPNEEYICAIKDNRIYGNQHSKVDFARLNDIAGERSLRDILSLMKPGQSLENYDYFVFYGCREFKGKGVAETTLGEGYNIKFTDIPYLGKLEKQEIPHG